MYRNKIESIRRLNVNSKYKYRNANFSNQEYYNMYCLIDNSVNDI